MVTVYATAEEPQTPYQGLGLTPPGELLQQLTGYA